MSVIDDVSATITADSSGYTAAMNTAQQATQSATNSMGEAFKNCGELLDVAITAPLTALAYTAVSSFNAATQSTALLNAELQATGNSVGFSATQLETMASNLDAVSGLGKTDIMSGVIDSLLKFQNISGSTFQSAANDAVGWAATGTVSLTEASQKIGMALENPTRAFALLRNSMAALTPDQERTITNMMNQGDIADAQTLILNKLNTAYGNMATQMGAASTPAKQLAADWKTIDENLAPFGGIIEKALVPFVNVITNISTAFAKMSPATQQAIVVTLAFVAAFAPILTGLGFFITTIVPAMAAGWGLIVSGAVALNGALLTLIESVFPFIAALALLVYSGQLVYDNWNVIKAEGVAAWSAIKAGVLSAIAGILSAMEKIPGMGNVFSSTIAQMRADAATDFTAMNQSVGTVTQSTGSFAQSWTNLKGEVSNATSSIMNSITGMTNHVMTSIKPVGAAIVAVALFDVPAWITALGQMQTLSQTVFESIRTAADSMANSLTAALTTGGMDWNQALGSALQAMLKSIVDWAVNSLFAVKGVAEAMSALWTLSPLLAIGLIAGLIAVISTMHLAPPAMAMGGLVTSPTTALIGEAGPEAVLPVVRLANGQMGVQTTGSNPSAGGSGSGGSNYMGGAGMEGSQIIQVNLDSTPILKAISRASRIGKLVIHPNAVRIQAVNP